MCRKSLLSSLTTRLLGEASASPEVTFASSLSCDPPSCSLPELSSAGPLAFSRYEKTCTCSPKNNDWREAGSFARSLSTFSSEAVSTSLSLSLPSSSFPAFSPSSSCSKNFSMNSPTSSWLPTANFCPRRFTSSPSSRVGLTQLRSDNKQYAKSCRSSEANLSEWCRRSSTSERGTAPNASAPAMETPSDSSLSSASFTGL
mmetsp:Transcript_9530/g.17383  ORF Transcript_9530/g.17383 Transcript_9530/m.17383 type:complete len:201 (-) Transcript_9530:298-900(-)